MRALNPAEIAVKGATTRLALYFQLHDRKKFTGSEVAQILLQSWQGYEIAQDTEVGAAMREFMEQYETPGGRLNLPAKSGARERSKTDLGKKPGL